MTTEWILKLKTVKRNRKTHYIQTQPIERKMERVRESWKTEEERESEHITSTLAMVGKDVCMLVYLYV